MKIIICVTLALFGAASCYPVSYHTYPSQVLDVQVLSSMTPLELEQFAGNLAAEELVRPKRSGSSGFLAQISQSVASGISKASAGSSSHLSSSVTKGISSASGSISGSSSGYGGTDEGYEYNKPKSPEFFTLKKSILNTIFQALKAITGGVTILKGQLIKGGGALTSGVGKLISVKGEAVANFGRHLVNTASLSAPKTHAPEEVHIAPSAPTHYGPPNAAPAYIHPSSPASSYGPPIPSITHYGHSSSGANFGPNAPISSILPPSSVAPGSFTSGHAFQGHPNTVFVSPTKHLSQLQGAHHGEDIYLKNEYDTSYPQHNHISSEAHYPGDNSITTAVDALHGVLKQPGYNYKQFNHLPPTAPAIEDSHNFFHPPPPPQKKYPLYSDYAIPFKPLNIPSDSYHSPSSTFSAKVDDDDYGPELTSKLTSMIDELLGVKKHHTNKHHPVTTYTYVAKKQGLDPIKLSRVNDNLDKLQAKLEGKESSRSFTDSFEMYKALSTVLKAIQNGKENETKIIPSIPINKKVNKSDEILLTQSSEYNKPVGRSSSSGDTNAILQKSVVYELRGNKLIKLTDEKTDRNA